MVEVATVLGVIAGILVSVAVIWKGLTVAYTFIHSIVEGMETLKTLPEWIEQVKVGMKELHPNHGSSMKDKLDLAVDDISEIKECLIEHIGDADKHN